ncbi:MAG: aminotransferase class I/II-fold pyridoxal phosphate-dependent enzyme [Gemmatimonadetes bacterium]|nr:aminotransferase class I/II-fold pyridoxal phosphate-dependent enzyme [Gemmatimonadota bacterium]MCA9762963.1 aminotransferase class I/II-fold pyridoxal phosphate-dependent enzyme [Gemmatimonadota bacterium]MCA9767236.1 aminotransferase class I/II-fold pyridoxal phosphate-dependent enzyme [Gemmatimonadota bacterium]HPF61877.1 aminotransferase class I/II-fold pyridoxal phosphate-dependent enzyme [Gemmatimonadales bacterium]HRX18584.1 aminotransferase class I/II-fold pyridoxal phosphate-depend
MTRFSARLEALPKYPLTGIAAAKLRLRAAGVDLIDLGAGDADGPPPQGTIGELVGSLGDVAMHKYGFQLGLPRFREAAAAWMGRRFGLQVDPAHELLPLIGSKEGLAHLALAVVDPGDVVIVPEPGYQAYIGGAVFAGGEPHLVPLEASRGFLLELDQLPEAVLARTRLVYVNYPNNPTAAVAPRDYLERLVACCRRHDIVLAYDNAYSDITFDGYVAPSILEIPGAREVAVEFFSMSKSFQMTGWRLGFAVGNPEIIAALAKVKSYVDTGAFQALQHAAAWTLDHAESLIPPMRTELQLRRDVAVAALREIGLPVASPQGAMYLWVPLPAGIASADFATSALEAEGVMVLPGSGFGAAGEGFFRIALTVPPARLREAITRLGRVIAQLLAAQPVSA